MGADIPDAVAVATDGSSYVIGLSDSFTFDQFGQHRPAISVVKFAPDGSLAWQRVWTGNTFRGQANGLRGPSVALSPDEGSLYVSGLTTSNANDAVLLKFSAAGDLLWQRTWGGGSYDEANAVAAGPDGSAYIAGSTDSFSASRSFFVAKFSADGALAWQKIWEGAAGHAVGVGPDGQVYAAGSRPRPDSLGNFDVLAIKMTGDGALVWSNTWSAGTQVDARGGMTVGSDGSPVIAGALQAEKGGIVGIAAMLLKLDANGALLLAREWGAGSGSSGAGVAVAQDGSMYVTGTTSQGDGTEGAFVFQVDVEGKGVNAVTWGGSGFEGGHGVGVVADGTVVLAASTTTAPPYGLFEASRKVSAIKGDVVAVTGSLADATGVAADPGLPVIVPDGRTAYAGNFETALVRFFMPTK